MADHDDSEPERDEEGFETVFVLTPKQQRDKYLFHAQLAEEITDYEQLKSNILHLVDAGRALSDSERKLFLLAFKNCVGARRKAWRVLGQEEQRMLAANSADSLLPHLRLYKSEVEGEIEAVCAEMLTAINTLLDVPNGELNTTERVFYWKLRGDYCRYLCEFQQNNQRADSERKALDAYNREKDEVMDSAYGLMPSDPQLLGLALNMSVFHYEILGNRQEGLSLCRDVYEAAEKHLREAHEELDSNLMRSAKDVLTLLKDNLQPWEQEQDIDRR